MVIPEIICEGGNDKELSRSHSENPDKILPTSDDWALWAQYAAGMACMKKNTLITPKLIKLFLTCSCGGAKSAWKM